MSKRRFGPAGAGISKRDILHRYIPNTDTDLYWEFAQRIRIPPTRLPPEEEVTLKKFKELLQSDSEAETITREQFMEMLKTPELYQRRQYLTKKERMAQVLEYFKNLEDQWWVYQQMKICWFIDHKNRENQMKIWKSWSKAATKKYMKKVEQMYKKLKKMNPEKAEEFADFAYDYLTERLSKLEPKPRQEGSLVVINRIRYLILKKDYYALRQLWQELGPLLK